MSYRVGVVGAIQNFIRNVLNTFLSPYVENLDPKQLDFGLFNGQINMKDLILRKNALAALKLPVEIVEGRVSRINATISWFSLGSSPVELLVEDVHVIVAPKKSREYDREAEDKSEQTVKQDKLSQSEALNFQDTEVSSSSNGMFQAAAQAVIKKVFNNIQISLKNVHIRYEDSVTVEDHTFAVGVTLANISAISTDANWKPSMLAGDAVTLRKLARLNSLAVYFDTDSKSLMGRPWQEAIETSRKHICSGDYVPEHQYLLKPVNGEGRGTFNQNWNVDIPQFELALAFEEIGFAVDNHQYHDLISMADVYQLDIRKSQYRKYKDDAEFAENRPRALLRFAGRAILAEVHDRRRRWSWDFMQKRRDNRLRYLELFKEKIIENIKPEGIKELDELEHDLTFNDIRFYRSITRSRLKKDKEAIAVLEQKRQAKQKQQQSWTGWMWERATGQGSSGTSGAGTGGIFTEDMTDEQKKELFELFDVDEKAALARAFERPKEAIKLQLNARLQQGSMTVRNGPQSPDGGRDILSLIFDGFHTGVLARQDNFEATLSLGNFRVFDDTSKETQYRQIVHVKESASESDVLNVDSNDLEGMDSAPFFSFKYEHNPLDGRADNVLSVYLRSMEIIYHKGYVEAIYNFFKPPKSQLQSLEALLSAAGQTLGDLQKETRAGLEFALESHKTIDLHMNLHAPIIIVPESILVEDCNHLVLDAGQVLVDSDLVSKETIKEVEQKRKQKYSDEDYQRLESLMYDNFKVQLKSAQFVMGHNLDACRTALKSETSDPELHLLERINIDLTARNSIVPTIHSVTRMKVSGKLPSLHINFSDSKYKTLMRLLDVTIPHFNDEEDLSNHLTDVLPSGPLFEAQPHDGSIDYETDDESMIDDGDKRSIDSSKTLAAIKQRLFEFEFGVDSLQVRLLRSGNGIVDQEKPLGILNLDRFSLTVAAAKFEMNVGVRLRSITVSVFQSSEEPLKLVSTESDADEKDDLMLVEYVRVQKASPDFIALYDGVEQTVDVALSTFVVQADPKPLLDVYDFIMTTFVPNQPTPSSDKQVDTSDSAPQETGQRIRVRVKLASFDILLLNGVSQLATLALSTAHVSVDLFGKTMQVSARLGNLTLTDDSPLQTASPDFKKLLSIEGGEVAEFRYETYDLNEIDRRTGVNSSIFLKTGALKLYFIEEPLHDLYVFLTKFARLKSFYDAARQAAVLRASEIERMGFDVLIRAPIIVLPTQPIDSKDDFTVRLGEVAAKNKFNGQAQSISAKLNGIQLTSTVWYSEEPSKLSIINDVTISTDLVQTQGIDRQSDLNLPDIQGAIQVSDVKIHLTQLQYCGLIGLSQTIPRALTMESTPEASNAEISTDSGEATQKAKSDLQPELDLTKTSTGERAWTTMDMAFNLGAVKLHLYDDGARFEADLKEHGISRLALNDVSVNFKMLSDNAMEAELAIKSLTMSNTKPGPSKHREIMPAAAHDRNQLMVLFSSSGGKDVSTVAIVTLDSPQVIFSIDPVFALSAFFMSAFPSTTPEETSSIAEAEPGTMPAAVRPREGGSATSFDLRFDLHDASISILEDDSKVDSQAVQFSVKQLSLSHQRIIALTIGHLAILLTRMGKQSDSVRVLDDVDLTLSLSLEDKASRQYTNISFDVQPIVLRISYRDIMLMTTIVNDAIDRLSKQNGTKETTPRHPTERGPSSIVSSKAPQTRRVSGRSTQIGSTRTNMQETSVIVSTEELMANFEGFRFVLISDLHESPMLHLQTKPFVISVSDWSSQLQASASMSTSITYWNLKNSHWEPFIDPWTSSLVVERESPSSALSLSMKSLELLDINVSSSFVELAISTANVWSLEGESMLQKARGSYPPYRIVNKTGGAVFVWSDLDGSRSSSSYKSVKIASGDTIDWRFDDWKSARESVSSSGYNAIGIQFDGKPWEQLRSVPVDREGQYAYSLRPRTEKVMNKVMCEIVIKDNVKIVTLRSTYKIANQTLYPLELTMVDNTGHPVSLVEKIAPGQSFSLPIEAVTLHRIRIQPDQGFGYRWSPPIKWEDLVNVRQSGLTIRCPHQNQGEAPFRFQVWPAKDTQILSYPQLTLNLRAPIELENLLPFNVQYKIYDRDSDQNWSSYLRKGGIMPVHSVELGHLVLLSVTAQDTGFKPSEFAIINTDGKSDFDIEQQLSLSDAKDRKLDIRLNYIKYPNSGGAFKVQIYCPYLVVNKTGLPLQLKSVNSRTGHAKEVAGEQRPDELAKTTPFMFSHPQKKGTDFIFKVGDSSWSQTINLEAPSAESALVLPSTTSRCDFLVGLSWTEGLGKYKLTKVVILAPRFFIHNKLQRALQFREHASAPARPELAPGERFPLLSMRSEERLLTLAYPGLNAQWCPAFKIEDIGKVHLRMREPDSSGSQGEHLVEAEVVIERSTMFINICQHIGTWPFVIENNSTSEISFGQTDSTRDRPEQKHIYKLQPHTKQPYAWDYPSAADKKIYLFIGDRARRIDIMEIGVLPPLKISSITRTLSLDVRADGESQILSITNYSEEESLFKPKRQDTGSISRRGSVISTSGFDFEAIEEKAPLSLIVKLDLKGVGISLMSKKLLEVVYLSAKDLQVEYSTSSALQSLNFNCGSLQVDNQLQDAQFPVVLQPTPIPKELQKVAALPTVQASVVLVNDNSHGILFVKYASILLQAITIQVDEAFLYAVLDLTKLEGLDWEADSENVLIEHPHEVPEPVINRTGQFVYFEVLELQPIILSVSFMRNFTPPDDGTQKMGNRNPLAVALNVLTMALGNLGDARLELNALGLKDARLTMPDLQGRVFFHYRQEVLRQLYRILGSADFLGNPVGLFTNVSSGVADIFYEPWKGVVQHGGSELGVGIAKGAASFVKKTVFGLSDSVTKVTGSLGKGLSAATLDAEYQSRRRQSQRRNKPKHAIYGVTAGAEAFANSVASGVEGVLMKPIEGAEAEGAMGFFKGMGKGLVGAVTKPVVGVFDLASNVSEGIRNTTTVFDAPQRDRVRKPRHVPADGVLQPYSVRAAIGQYWLRDLDNGRYRKEFYMAHIDIPGGDNVVLITTNRVLSFWSRNLRLMWDMPFSTVQGVTIENTGIRFVSKAGKDQDRFVSIASQSSIEWFFKEVANVVKAYNARRRLER